MTISHLYMAAEGEGRVVVRSRREDAWGRAGWFRPLINNAVATPNVEQVGEVRS